MSSNLFYSTAQEIIHSLRRAGVRCAICHRNAYNNSIYINLETVEGDYHKIRISDHRGRLHTRYTVRSDINQSKKLEFNGVKYFIYSIKDIRGLIGRILHEVPSQEELCKTLPLV